MPSAPYDAKRIEIAARLERLAGRSHPAEVDDARSRRGLWRTGSPELNVVPLIDVLFLLMIFFVIAGTFEMGEGIFASRMLPVGAGQGSVALPFSPIVVEFKAGGSNTSDPYIKLAGTGQPLASHEELVAALADLRSSPGFDAETPVIIMSDDAVLWDFVAEGWNDALRAGFRDIAFASAKRESRDVR